MDKTARELTPEEIRSYHPWQTLERFQEDLEIIKRREQAWEVAKKVAKLLKDKYGATRVVVFGSLSHRAWSHRGRILIWLYGESLLSNIIRP